MCQATMQAEPSNYQIYYDANNLYGWAMSQSLPECGFAWVDEPESVDYINVSEDAETGYILEVDLEYPAEIYDQHNDYPMAPEKRTVRINDLSEYSQTLRKVLGLKGNPNEKLVPNLNKKEKYVVHYRNLQQYVSHGLKVIKVHRVIMFQQSKWLAEYIALNTEKRKAAKNPFKNDFFKLNNANEQNHGKCSKRINVKIVQTERRFKKVVAKPTFHRFKTIQVGFSILVLSKTFMYEFHYDYIKDKSTQRHNCSSLTQTAYATTLPSKTPTKTWSRMLIFSTQAIIQRTISCIPL